MDFFGWLKTPIKKVKKEKPFDIDLYARLHKPFDASHYTEYGKEHLNFISYYKYVGDKLYYWSKIYEEWELYTTRQTADFKRRLKEF